MRLGITLIVVGALAAIGLAGSLAAASSDGTLALGAASLTPRMVAFAASAVAIAATTSLFLGLLVVRQARRRPAFQVVVDEHVAEAERDARVRPLAIRLELQRDVGVLERRRAAAAGELSSSTVLIDGDDGDEGVVVVLLDGQEPTVLGQRPSAAHQA